MNQKNGMNDEQQIEEIAIVLCGMTKGCDGCTFNKEKCFEYQDAKRIYNAGYRKQRDGEFVTDDLGNVCTVCGRTYDPQFDIEPRIIREFKFCPNCGAKMK